MKTGTTAYLLAMCAALAAALFPFYVELAVGVIGPPGGPIILLELGVLAVGIVGSIIARFRARGMASALLAAACAQVLAALIAVTFLPGHPASPTVEVLGVNGVFVALFAGAAWLFRRAARAALVRA